MKRTLRRSKLIYNHDVAVDNERIMESTLRPEVFFECRKLYFESMTLFSNCDYLPENQLAIAYAQDIDRVNRFIDRYWKEIERKARRCHSIKDMDSQYRIFFDKLDAYQYTMDDCCVAYYNQKELSL